MNAPHTEHDDQRVAVKRVGKRIAIVHVATDTVVTITPRQAIAIIGFLRDLHDRIRNEGGGVDG